MQEFSLLGRDQVGSKFSILTHGVSKQKAVDDMNNVYRPDFGGDYLVHLTSLVFEHRGFVFHQLGKGRDCVLSHEKRVRFGSVEDIKGDIDMILDFGSLPPKGKRF